MARGNPGRLLKLADGRLCIEYRAQPLFKQDKIILHLVDEDYAPVMGESGKPKIIIKKQSTYAEEMKGAALIGFVD